VSTDAVTVDVEVLEDLEDLVTAYTAGGYPSP
jgi:hypothetical protein